MNNFDELEAKGGGDECDDNRLLVGLEQEEDHRVLILQPKSHTSSSTPAAGVTTSRTCRSTPAAAGVTTRKSHV